LKKVLYIIGNGFDRHHGMLTSYFDFANYLKDHDLDLFELLQQYISFPSEDSDLWNRLEENLAYIDIEGLLSDNTDYLPSFSSDNFVWSDIDAFPGVMSDILESLTTGLIDIFQKFILNIKIPQSAIKKKINFDKDSLFFNFNYTSILEDLYYIAPTQILYIHNKAKSGMGQIILGHGITPENFKEKEISQPENLTEEELQNWIEWRNDNYDFSYETGKETIYEYFTQSYKPTKEIIESNKLFFNQIAEVEKVYVLGHSLSNVDLPYFIEIKKSIKTSTEWIVTYWGEKEKDSHLNTLEKIGIQRRHIKMIELSELQIDSNQLKLDFK